MTKLFRWLARHTACRLLGCRIQIRWHPRGWGGPLYAGRCVHCGRCHEGQPAPPPPTF